VTVGTIEEKSEKIAKDVTEEGSDTMSTEALESSAFSPLLAKLSYKRDVDQLQKHTRVIQYCAPDCYPTTASCRLG
jgi:hypothetical protein